MPTPLDHHQSPSETTVTTTSDNNQAVDWPAASFLAQLFFLLDWAHGCVCAFVFEVGWWAATSLWCFILHFKMGRLEDIV
ncbi:hypothetical protein Droror1_Dr00024835, partial [Drosera rotundifolia]